MSADAVRQGMLANARAAGLTLLIRAALPTRATVFSTSTRASDRAEDQCPRPDVGHTLFLCLAEGATLDGHALAGFQHWMSRTRDPEHVSEDE